MSTWSEMECPEDEPCQRCEAGIRDGETGFCSNPSCARSEDFAPAGDDASDEHSAWGWRMDGREDFGADQSRGVFDYRED